MLGSIYLFFGVVEAIPPGKKYLIDLICESTAARLSVGTLGTTRFVVMGRSCILVLNVRVSVNRQGTLTI